MMHEFKVWVTRMDGATSLQVADLDNAEWLLNRLSDYFVFKTCEPVRKSLNSSALTFRVAHNSQLSALRFERILAGIAEIKMIVEPLEQPSDKNGRNQL
jgi:hypothetical protein